MKKFLSVLFISVAQFALAQELFNEKALIENIKYLSSDALQGRKTETQGNATARTFIKEQFKKLSLQPLADNYELPFEFTTRSGAKVKGINLAGWIKGTSKSGKFVVISAHYDHLGMKDEKVFNGADDNASGTCALFAIAEYFKKNAPEHDLLFVAFDAEESGLQGAKAFVKSPPVPIETILVDINMDMIARADNKELVACGMFFYPNLKPFIEKVGNSENVKIVFGHDDPAVYKGALNWTYSSDHGPFHTAKIPFVYFGVSDHKDYHQATDDFEKIDSETYLATVRLVLRASQEIDRGLN
jgi:Zn-dependent M28 family amino/carboxypeptidase